MDRRIVPIGAITVKEKIQLHLFDNSRFADAHEVPLEVTQAGIAQAVGVRVHHVPQYVRPLITEGLVEERTSHVRRQRRRRKVYFLTERGRSHAATQRAALLKETVPFRTRGGEVRDAPLMRVVQEDRRGATLLELLQELQSLGYITEVPKAAEPGFVDFTQEAVKVDRFYGRERELEEVVGALDRVSVVVVTGMAGVGKTAFASKICERLRGTRSLFWRQVRPWDTAIDLALRLSAFLQLLGRPGLHAALTAAVPKEMSRVEELLAADLAGVRALLVLDDVHDASEDARAFLSVLVRVLNRQKETASLLVSRTVPDVYSRREVAVEGSVCEFTLKGLDRESSRSLLEDAGVADPLVGSLAEACGGSPLFLKLLAATGPKGTPGERWRTLETYIAEQIEPSLAADERACLELASLYRLPVPSDGLLLEAFVHGRTLISLRRRGLLDEVREERVLLHDTIRSYVRGGLSSERKASLVGKVVPWLLARAEAAVDGGNPQEAVGLLGNVIGIEVDPSRRLATLERLGDVRRSVGDYPGAIEAYGTALREAGEAATQARFHQKIAASFEARGLLREAEQEIREGMVLLTAQPSHEAAWLLFRQASVAYSRQEYDRVLQLIEGLTGWMPILARDPDLWGWITNMRGLVHLYDPRRADPALARADFQTAVEAFEAVDDRPGLCLAYNNLGLAAQELGEMDACIAHLERSAQIARQIGDLPALGTALFTKAWTLMEYSGDYNAAEALYRETYRLAKEAHRRQKVIWHYTHFAVLYRRQGRHQEAREALEYFLSASGDMLNAESRIEYLCLLARICVECGDRAAAEGNLEQVETLLREAPSDSAAHCVEWARALVRAGGQEWAAAEASFRRAFELPHPGNRGEFLLDYGRFLSSLGNVAEAKAVLSEACATLAGKSKPLEQAARGVLVAVEAENPSLGGKSSPP